MSDKNIDINESKMGVPKNGDNESGIKVLSTNTDNVDHVVASAVNLNRFKYALAIALPNGIEVDQDRTDIAVTENGADFYQLINVAENYQSLIKQIPDMSIANQMIVLVELAVEVDREKNKIRLKILQELDIS